MKNSMKQIVTVLLLASILLMMSGCYGSFNLTQKVYKWNGTVGVKWTNELVFLVLNVIPVYSVAVAVDAIVLNSIELDRIQSRGIDSNNERRSNCCIQCRE